MLFWKRVNALGVQDPLDILTLQRLTHRTGEPTRVVPHTRSYCGS
jgi:hypothetical protein